MGYPDNLKYTKDHEWVRVEGEVATIGITEYAAEQLGDIVYIELPKEGEEVSQGEPFGVIESVKAVSDLYGALSGTVTEINDSIAENPETLNEDCYEEGWLIRVQLKDKEELGKLMTPAQYQAHIEEEA